VIREANVVLISSQSTSGKSCVADANVGWDTTIVPSLSFGVGAAYDRISQDLDLHNPNPNGGPGTTIGSKPRSWPLNGVASRMGSSDNSASVLMT